MTLRRPLILTIDHGIPLERMTLSGISGIIHDWFRSYLNNRKHFCKVDDVSADIKEISFGVPQGSCLETFCFVFSYINDIKENKSKHILWSA